MIFAGAERIIMQGRLWLQDAYFKIKKIPATTFTSETGSQPTTPEADHIYAYVKTSAINAAVASPWWKDEAGTQHEVADAATVPPIDADYLVKTSNATLTAERVVTDTASITVDWSTAGQAKFQREALTGDVTASQNSNATTIANDAVTTAKIINDAVTNAKLANMAAWTLKARNNAASGDPQDVALADLTTATPATGDYVVGMLSTGELRKYLKSDVAGTSSGSGASGHWHSLTRLLGDGSTTVFNLSDFLEYLDGVYDDGIEVDPQNYTLSADGGQVTMSYTVAAGNVLTFKGVQAAL